MKTYTIKKIDGPITDQSWELAEVAKVDYVPCNNRYPYPYQTSAQLLYTDEALHVRMQTNERPLTALANKRNDPVCKDSCMEFFLSPDGDDKRYFNFEINPLGTLLLYRCSNQSEPTIPQEPESILNIKSVITSDSWTLTYQIPFSFILRYFNKITDVAYGNFYKCGDESAVTHYATWNPLTCEEISFHRPEFFGKLIFEKGISVNS